MAIVCFVWAVATATRIRGIIKRGFLRQIVAGAKQISSTVNDALIGAQASVFSDNFKRGRLLISTSGGGNSGSFEMSVAGKEFTQDNIFAMLEELIEVLTDTLNEGLAIDTGIASDSDDLFTIMCEDDRLAGVTSEGVDVTSLNVPSIGGIPSQ